MKNPLGNAKPEPADVPAQETFRLSSVAYRLIFFALIAIGIVVLLIWRSREVARSGSEQPAVGKQLNSIDLEPLTETVEPIRSANLQGKIVLINYWGTWCPPCRQEFPHLMEVGRRLRNQADFLFVSVSCGPGNIASDNFEEDREDLRTKTLAFLHETETELPVHCDRTGSMRLAVQKAGELEDFLYPTTLVLDRVGIIRGIWNGYEPGMEVEIESLLWELLKN